MALWSQRAGILHLLFASAAKVAVLGCAVGLLGVATASRLLDNEEGVRAAYGQKYEQLVALKAKIRSHKLVWHEPKHQSESSNSDGKKCLDR